MEKRFIDESIRIRKEYLKFLSKLKDNENNISKIKDDILKAYEMAHINDIDKELMETKIKNLTSEVTKMKNHIEPIVNNINDLKNDADKLFEKIQEKYPNVTKEKLIELLSPHVQNIDNDYDGIFKKP